MSRRYSNIGRDELLRSYELYGSFKRAASALGMSRSTYSRLWWEIVGEDPLSFKRCHFRFGVVSDTHLGSIYQQLTHLKSFYRFAKSLGCEYIIHAGDLTDGISMPVVHQKDRFLTSVEDMIDYVVGNYPDDVDTFVISGNHDELFMKMFGRDICSEIADLRDDITYIGSMHAIHVRHGIKTFITHGVCNYSRDSRSESRAQIMKMARFVPDIIINGHTHTWRVIPNWCDSFLVHAPCMVGGFNSMKKYTVHPTIGAMIVDVFDDRTFGIRFTFYNEIEDDY